jgi:hypothetical protein
MEPLSLILAALIAGTAKTAGEAVQDAYKGLKTLIKRKFEGMLAAEMVLEEHEKDPETFAAPLKKKLAEAEADKDEEILKASQRLMEIANPEEAAAGKYNISIAGDFKGIAGDISGGKVTLTFN